MSHKEIIQTIKEQKHLLNLRYTVKVKTEAFTRLLFYALFDEATPLEETLENLEKEFKEIVNLVCQRSDKSCEEMWNLYLESLPEILVKLNKDAVSIVENDPAANSLEEVYLAYPGFFAIAVYRLAHELNKFKLPLVPRLMTECAHKLTGVDINPRAEIGVPFFIDHATGVVIGETCIIKNNVRIYQGVTLGALSVDKNFKNIKRHPTIENNVTIYANATILGGETVIGANSVIGGNVWLTKSVPENSIVSHNPQINIKNTVRNE